MLACGPVGRALYAAAAALLVVSFIGLRHATSQVAHYPAVLSTGAPARVYQPGEPRDRFAAAPEGERLPAVVLAHGFSGTSGMMSSLARALARSGYLALTLDLTGHGQNGARFDESSGEGRLALVDDVQAAVEFLRSHERVDVERVGVIGHSMGAGAVLRYGARDPSVAAVVAISGGRLPPGPYPPPNVLLLFAEGDPARSREAWRELGARLAGMERLVADRTYGEPERGGAVRVSEVAGVNHLTILYSREAWVRVVGWLRATLGPGAPEGADPPADGRYLWSALGFLAFVVLLWGAPRALRTAAPHVPLPRVERPARALLLFAGALALSALLLAGVDAGARGPFSFLPLVGARDLQGFLLIAGVLLCALLVPAGELRGAGLERGTLLAAFALFALSYLVLGTLLQPFTDAWLSPARAPWFLVATALALPFFGASEWMLRGQGARGVWLPILGKLLVVLAVLAAALFGLVPRVLLLALGAGAALFVLLELAAYRLSRVLPNPWLAALYQSLLVSWIPAATFPLTG